MGLSNERTRDHWNKSRTYSFFFFVRGGLGRDNHQLIPGTFSWRFNIYNGDLTSITFITDFNPKNGVIEKTST